MGTRSAWIVPSIISLASIAHAGPEEGVAALRARADAEMAEARYADAAADYGVAYGIVNDPELLRSIAGAKEKLGNCDAAIAYYRRYLKEARPGGDVEASVNERIAACAGTGVAPAADPPRASAAEPPPAPAADAPTSPAAAALPPGHTPGHPPGSPPASPTGQPAAEALAPPVVPLRADKRFVLGVGLGFGVAGHSGEVCNGCESLRRGGAFSLALGIMQTPRFAWIAQLSFDAQPLVTYTDSPLVPFGEIHRSLEQHALLVGARGWLDRRWWLEGTAGVARAVVPPYVCESGIDAPPGGCDPSYESAGAAFAAQLGAELISRRSFALEARARLAAGAYSDVSFAALTFGVGLDWFP
jgi:tetratricopeptide (TPR) repeat protein